MAKPKEEFEVHVLSRQDITTFPKIATPVINVLVTYVAAGLPPATVTIDKSKWSPELEKSSIRADIEARLKRQVETYKV